MTLFPLILTSSWRRWMRVVCRIASIVLVGVLSVLWWPVGAQDLTPEVAPVTLDGRVLFEVSDTVTYDAQERAEWVEKQLQEVVASQTTPDITLESRGQLPVIVLNDRITLLTVTEADTPASASAQTVATQWSEEIRVAIEQAQLERSYQFLWIAALQVITAFSLALLLHILSKRVWQRIHTYFSAQSNSDQTMAPSPLWELILPFSRGSIWLVTSLYCINLFPYTRQVTYQLFQLLRTSFTSPIITIGEQSNSILDFLLLAIFFFGLVVGVSQLTRLLRSRILQITGIHRSWQETIVTLTRYVLITIGSIVLLQVWGLDLSSLALIASAVGIGIGFGLQDIAKDFSSGLIMIFEQSIKVGDFVELNNYMGTVEHIGGRSTVIRTLDQVSIIVPNSRFLVDEVINWSHLNPISRLHIPVGVAYRSNLDQVKQALLEAAELQSEVLTSPSPRVLFKGFGNSSLDFELLVWISEPSRQPIVKSNLNFAIEAALNQHGVEIPFPQRDLHVRSGSLPLELSPELHQSLLALLQAVVSTPPSTRNHHDRSQS